MNAIDILKHGVVGLSLVTGQLAFACVTGSEENHNSESARSQIENAGSVVSAREPRLVSAHESLANGHLRTVVVATSVGRMDAAELQAAGQGIASPCTRGRGAAPGRSPDVGRPAAAW